MQKLRKLIGKRLERKEKEIEVTELWENTTNSSKMMSSNIASSHSKIEFHVKLQSQDIIADTLLLSHQNMLVWDVKVII